MLQLHIHLGQSYTHEHIKGQTRNGLISTSNQTQKEEGEKKNVMVYVYVDQEKTKNREGSIRFLQGLKINNR